VRRKLAADRERAERSKRHQIAVEFANPIDQAIATGVGNQYVATSSAISNVFVADRGVGRVVADRIEHTFNRLRNAVVVVICINQIVSVTAKDVVLASSADEPIVAKIAEHIVVAIGVNRRRSALDRAGLRRAGVSGVEVAEVIATT